jgi:hypothetical protein
LIDDLASTNTFKVRHEIINAHEEGTIVSFDEIHLIQGVLIP